MQTLVNNSKNNLYGRLHFRMIVALLYQEINRGYYIVHYIICTLYLNL